MSKRVVIVGAGVIGLFCAVRLRQGGARVTLIEAEPEHPSAFGPAASAAAAGMLAPIEPEPSPHERLALASYDLWRSLQPGSEWADGVRFDGCVFLAESEAHAAQMIANAERLGRKASHLTHGQARKRLPFDVRLDHAVLLADEGVADPARVMTGLAMQARALGALIEFNTDAMSATASAVLAHDDTVFDADYVVLAPGAWAREKLMLAAPALRRLRPAKGQLVQVRVKGPLSENVRAPDFYLAQRRDDVVLGATLEFDRFDRKPDPEKTETLLAAVEARLPGEVTPEGVAWAGIRPMSPDGWPMIGPDGDGALIAAGHSRNGWLLAPLTAEIISAYVFGTEIAPEWAALSPQRFTI